MNHRRRFSIILELAALPLAGCSAAPSATAATAPFVYVANTKSDQISQYSAPPSVFGALTPLAPATVPAGPFPYGIAIDPQATSVYAADVNGNEVSQYTINPITGQLTPKTPTTVAAGRGSTEVAVTPNGKSAYVTDYNAVSQYSINPTTGNLIPKSPATVAAGRQSEAIAISPNGKYVYVSNCPACRTALKGSHPAAPSKPQTATIWEYRINQHTGALSPIGSVTTGTGANGIAITPNGKSLYVAVAAVWQYTINQPPANSAPSRKRPSPRQAEPTKSRSHPTARTSTSSPPTTTPSRSTASTQEPER